MRAGFPGRMSSAIRGNVFSPTQISNLLLWLDAEDTSTIEDTSGKVSQWNDKSGQGSDATQGTDANRPITGTVKQNGKNVLDFEGTDDTLAFPNLSLNGLTDVSVFVVLNVDSTTSGSDNPLAFGSGSEGRLETSGASSTNIGTQGLGFFADGTILAAGMEDSTNLLGIVTSAAASRSYKNGTLVAEDLTPPSAWTTGAGAYGIMASDTPNRWTKGQFAEVIIFNKTLSDDERLLIETYLTNKWGI